jgi:hypothetical protein
MNSAWLGGRLAHISRLGRKNGQVLLPPAPLVLEMQATKIASGTSRRWILE